MGYADSRAKIFRVGLPGDEGREDGRRAVEVMRRTGLVMGLSLTCFPVFRNILSRSSIAFVSLQK